MTTHPLDIWHQLVRTQDPAGLNELLASDAVFYPPVVHTPQRGGKLAVAYWKAAFNILVNSAPSSLPVGASTT